MSADRFEVLYEGYCDGTLGPAEREEFLDLLRDPAHRARFVHLSTFAAIVADEVGVTASEERVSSRTLRALRAPRRPRAERSSPAPWIGTVAAAAALLIMIGIGFSGPRPAKPVKPAEEVRRPDPPPPPPAPHPAPAPAVHGREEREPQPLIVPPPPRRKIPDSFLPPPVAPDPPRPKTIVKPPDPAPKEPEATVAAIARIEALTGRVSVSTATSCLNAVAGFELRGEESIETAAGAAAWIRFPDGTRVVLGSDTLLARISESAAGKALRLDRGLLGADVEKQPKPMSVAGPHAEAVVLGTEFTLSAAPGWTRLDVREGRVRFARGVSSVVVGAGQYAVAIPGQDLAAKPGTSMWKAPALGLLSWLRADVFKAGAKGVAAWLDQSPAGNSATQAQAGSQPQYVDEVRPALRFDGADDFLELPSGMSEFRGGLSAFVVARVAATPATVRFIDLGAGPSCDNTVFGRKDGALAFWAYANGQTRGKVEVPGAVAVDQWAAYAVVAQPGGRALLYRNGAVVGAGTTSPLPGEARKPNFVGKSNIAGEPPFRGELAELLLYQRAVTDAERQHIEAYLGAKYLDPSLPAALPRQAAK